MNIYKDPSAPLYSLDERDIFLRGNSIFLKALTEDDVLHSGWHGWFNDKETTKFMQKHYFPNTKEEQVEFWRTHIKGSFSKLQLGIFNSECPDKLLGCVGLQNIDYINRKAEVSTIMGEKEGRNIKFYLEANELVIHHGFTTLNLRRVYGGTMIKEVADTMCRVLGFTIEGISRQDMFKNGQYHDIYQIGLLKQDFKELMKKVG